MKKQINLLLVITILILNTISCKKNIEPSSKNEKGMDSSLKTVKKSGKFVVGLDDSFPPMGFRDENGNIVGFDIDLAEEVAKRMGVKAEFKPIDWDGAILSLKNKDVDMIWNGLTITPARMEQIRFSDVYLTNRQVVITSRNSPIKIKTDLSGKIIGLQMGSSSEIALNNDANIAASLKEIKKYSNNVEALMDLANGRIDAVIIDEVVGRYYINKKPELYTVLEENFGAETYGVGFRKKDISLTNEINRFLKEMTEDGTISKISEKWFSTDILDK